MRVKVCGITRREDAVLAVELGAVALGFVFWPRSPRAVTAATVRDIADGLPPFVTPGRRVREPAARRGARRSRRAGLTCIQLHGDEDAADYVAAAARDQGAAGRRGFHPVGGGGFAAADHAAARRARSGTARRHRPAIEWTVAAAAARLRPVILSGGLNAGNVKGGRAVRPYAVDVSSGVEAAPGIKDESSCARSLPRCNRRMPRCETMIPAFGHRDPDARGYYGDYGGRFVPETLVAPVAELERAYFDARRIRRSIRSSRTCCALTSGARRRSTRRGA